MSAQGNALGVDCPDNRKPRRGRTHRKLCRKVALTILLLSGLLTLVSPPLTRLLLYIDATGENGEIACLVTLGFACDDYGGQFFDIQ
jgi:hypothetical protein